MDNVADLTKSLAEMLSLANQLFGTAAQSWDELVDTILPPRLALLKRWAELMRPEAIRKILDCLGLPSRPPPIASAALDGDADEPQIS
jgi:hypothetical protein